MRNHSDAPDDGRLAVRGLTKPVGVVGAALEASSFHPGRTARDRLRVLTRTADVDDARIDGAASTLRRDVT